MSEFSYFAQYGSLGNSALKFTEQKSGVKSTHWGTYFARYGFRNKSVLKFSDQSAGVVSSSWAYQASGNICFGGFTTVETYYKYYSYESAGGEQGVNSHPGIILKGLASRKSSSWSYIWNFGFAGKSRLLLSNTSATVKAFHVPYIASGNMRTGSSSAGFFVYNSSGQISTGSTSSIALVYSSLPVGNIRTNSTSDIIVFRNAYASIGNIRVVGGSNAPSYYRPQYVASGSAYIKGNAREGMSRWSFAASGGIVLYTPSYFEIISRQDPLGFWIRSETAGPLLTNGGTLDSLANADTFGTPFFDRFNWIPTQPNAKSVNFDSLFTYALVPSCVEINDNFLKRRTISFVIHMYDVSRRGCVYDESSTVNGLNVYVFNGYLYFHVFSFQGLGFISYSIKTPILANRTYHAAFTFDADDPVNTIVCYLNGNKSASSNIDWLAASELPPRNPVGFGAKINGTRYNDDHSVNGEPSRGRGHYLRGDLQALCVWDTVLDYNAIALQANAMFGSYSMTPLFIGMGGMTTDGICEIAYSNYSYTAILDKIITKNSSDVNITFTYEASGGNATVGPGFPYLSAYPVGNAIFGGSAGIQSSNWSATSTGNLQTGGSPVCGITFNYQAGGFVAISGLPIIASSNHLFNSSGNVVFSGTVSAGFFVDLSHIASGKAIFSNVGSALYSMVYAGTGGIKSNGTASALYSIEVEKDFTWDISKGILRYWRVEGRPKPFSCPPVGGSASSYKSDSYINYVVNVMAYSVSEVCEKLKAKSFYGPIKRIQVFSHPALVEDRDETFDPTCNTLTDVSPNVAECFDFLVDVNVLTTVGVSTFVTSDFSYVVSTSGSMRMSGIAEARSSGWAYVGSGGVVFGNESTNSSPGNPFVKAFGGSVLSGTSTYYSSYGGEFHVGIGAFVSSVSEGIRYGFKEAEQLTVVNDFISTLCCGNLPTTLFLNHEFSRFNKLSSFMRINGLSFARNLHMVYSKKKGLWANNLHYQGIGTTNDLETWDIISEFGCMDNLGGLKVSGSLLGFSFVVKNRNLRTLNDNYTRIVIGFNPDEVCSLDGSLDYAMTLNTKNSVVEATMDTTTIITDGIGLFQNRSFVVDPNIDFRVTSFSTIAPASNLDLSRQLQELLV
jgi:hypothetical protein